MKRLCYKCFSKLPENANYCPICGDMCWKRPEDEALILYNGLDGAACTRCGLKMGGDAS